MVCRPVRPHDRGRRGGDWRCLPCPKGPAIDRDTRNAGAHVCFSPRPPRQARRSCGNVAGVAGRAPDMRWWRVDDHIKVPYGPGSGAPHGRMVASCPFEELCPRPSALNPGAAMGRPTVRPSWRNGRGRTSLGKLPTAASQPKRH
ncbi:hypothetical protein TcCL_NonESM07118 [Trypanosoma cruzi]|nr:hypothetical protein TcCL_NonESM07118 [Trypanosoma cruzi]